MWSRLTLVPIAASLVSCGPSLVTSANRDANTWTLYRSSLAIPNARMHVATFDATPNADGSSNAEYNQTNCNIVADLMKQQGVEVRYWCESGTYNDQQGNQ